MPRKDSFPRKPTRKAATPSRSTTSSTTGRTREKSDGKTRKTKAETASPAEKAAGRDQSQGIDAPSTDTVLGSQLLPAASQAKRLSIAQQETYLHVLTRGASPASACGKIGVSALDVLATIEQDESFCERLDQVAVLLSQNVAAALYRSAMEGSVSAQTFFLKNQPPPNWHHSQPSEAADDPFSKMTDDELLAYCRASGIDWPTQTETGTDSTAVAD